LAAAAELTLAATIVCAGSFSSLTLVLLLVLGSQSLLIRGFGWSDVGLHWPIVWRRTALQAVVASLFLLVVIKVAIVPFAVFIAQEPLDLSAFGEPGDTRTFATWLAQAWTLAAFGEEMVFRGYLIPRITEFIGDTSMGRVIAVIASSALFGFAHRYQGWAGVIATAIIGMGLGTLYLWSRRNLWAAVLCHGFVDAVHLSALYLGHRSLLLS
jgi:membrane protease YdiL (CAAX protease family)